MSAPSSGSLTKEVGEETSSHRERPVTEEDGEDWVWLWAEERRKCLIKMLDWEMAAAIIPRIRTITASSIREKALGDFCFRGFIGLKGF